jgi:CHAT domain-containing protein
MRNDMCPDPQALAAFIDGMVFGVEHDQLCKHLRLCDACLEVIRLTGKAHVEYAANLRPSAGPRARSRWLPAVATAAMIAFAFVIVRSGPAEWFQRDPMKQLVQAAPRDRRTLEPRVSGFPWAPQAETMRGTGSRSPEELQFIGVTGAVLRRTADNSSIAGRHAAALAYLFSGEPREAAARLRVIALSSRDPKIWADLAAASYAVGLKEGSSVRFSEALAAADASLALDPQMPEALFNRALILEYLHRDDRARAAWERYLAVDGSSPWAEEARYHLTVLRPLKSSSDELRGLSRDVFGARNRQTELAAASHRAAVRGDWVLSRSLLRLELMNAERAGNDNAIAEILLMLARIDVRMGEAATARTVLAQAREAAERIGDAAARMRVEAASLSLASELARSPAEAIQLLNDALARSIHSGARADLPALYLARGRALAALGRTTDVSADFDAGIRALACCDLLSTTKSVGTFRASDRSWDRGIVREELYDEATALALSRGDTTGAFAYAEHARTRSFDGVIAMTPSAVDKPIIEYAALPERLVIFVVTDGTIRVTQRPIARSTLSRERDLLAFYASTGDIARFHSAASRLYMYLIEPIADEIASRQHLIIVPDATLSGVPFAALVDANGRYLVERYTLTFAPSAEFAARDRATSRAIEIHPRLLLVDAQASRESAFAPLASARREMNSIAALYEPRLTESTSRSLFERLAATADVIHFAGHALSPDDGVDPALLFSDADGKDEQLTAREIAAMHLYRAQLVILASCSTARDRNDGELSLAEAFLKAGAHNVVGTLWDIADRPAAEFFPRLHLHLANGYPPADALRAAQLESISRRDAPNIWAAVELIAGDANQCSSAQARGTGTATGAGAKAPRPPTRIGQKATGAANGISTLISSGPLQVRAGKTTGRERERYVS